MDQELFNPQSSSVSSSRILYTPSAFARTSLLHLQEVGSLQAIHQHTSTRTNLTSFLCFVVLSGTGSLTYEGMTYELSAGDCVFIDCRKAYSHSTSDNLWSLQWCHFYSPFLATVYKGNIIKNLIMDCQSYTKYRPNETTGGIFVSWRRKEELPTGA